ncbi:[protein-PII] uridylyltransferase family protein [Nautilia sp.]
MQLQQIIYTSENDLEIAKAIKREIKEYLNSIKIEGGKDFFVKHTKKIDEFVTLIYKYILKKSFQEFQPPFNNIPVSIIALGSYGREQLPIYSDIDIMIVYKETPGYNLRNIIENYITMLWDLGLKIGHRVHELKDLFPASNEDITIKTAMLESRFIFGSKFLWYEIQNELNKMRNYNKKEYILAKYDEMLKRHKKHPISMEPDIKDGFGGIRDSNTLLWINKVIFNYPNNSYLIPEYATEEDFREYRSSLEFLFKVRVYLHLAAKKKIDKVLLTYQREIALNMGYTDSLRISAERKFIKDLLKSLWNVNIFTSIVIKKIIKPYLYSHGFKEMKNKRVKKDYYLCENILYTRFCNKETYKEAINSLIEINYKKCDISVVSLLKEKDFGIIKKQKKALFYKDFLYPLLFALYKSKTLEKIIPAFEKIKYLAQFDGYHQYPVDIHSLYTVKEIENLTEFQKLNETDKAVLRFAALFHDLGKGRIEDHSVIGAKIAKEYAQKFSMPDTEIIAKLVKHHTLMSNTAQREDIHNDKIILSFAEIIQNERFLKLLYLLTIADMKAVGEGIFTPFKESLLQTLYYNTLNALENKTLINEIAQRKRKEKLLSSKEKFIQFPKLFRKKVLSSPSNQLFLQNSVNEILKLLEWIKDTKEYKYKFENEKHLIIHIAKNDRLNFSLGWFIDKLSKLELNHLSIYKIGELKYFKIEFDKKVDEYDLPVISEYIKKAFEQNLTTKHTVQFKKEEFEIDCNHSQNYASLKLKTKDKKGIVSTIMQVLDDFNIRVEDVKISTQKNIARDLFIISKENGFCGKIDEILKRLCK